MLKSIPLLLLFFALGGCFQFDRSHQYWIYATAESEDKVYKIVFVRDRLINMKEIEVGVYPLDLEGAHGIRTSPDGKHWYVTMAHGRPEGSLHMYSTSTDEWIADVQLGIFPATMDISKSTGMIMSVNFNLHGKHIPSSVNVTFPHKISTHTHRLGHVKQIPVGIMPHGGRFTSDGNYFYCVTMMDDTLYEISVRDQNVVRTIKIENEDGMMVSPTWVTPSPDDQWLYVAGNKSGYIYKINRETFKIIDKYKISGKGAYNLDITSDGNTLIATYKSSQAIGVWNLIDKKETVIKTQAQLPHGVVISPDQKFAFVTEEGIAGEPGVVEAFDLKGKKSITSLNIGKQASGIALWKVY